MPIPRPTDAVDRPVNPKVAPPSSRDIDQPRRSRVTGWRYWHVEVPPRPGEPGRRRDVLLGSPVSIKGETDSHDVWESPAQRVASCRHHKHPAPDPGCRCGYRVCETRLTVLIEMVSDRPERSLIDPRFCPRLVILQVEGSGRIEPGVAGDDPEGTWRCERLAILGGGFASPALDRHEVDRLSKRYGVGLQPARPGLTLIEWCIELNGGPPLRDL